MEHDARGKRTLALEPGAGFEGLAITSLAGACVNLPFLFLVCFPFFLSEVRDNYFTYVPVAGLACALLALFFIWMVSKKPGWEVMRKVLAYRICTATIGLVNMVCIVPFLFPAIPSNLNFIFSAVFGLAIGTITFILGIKASSIMFRFFKAWPTTPTATLGANFAMLSIIGSSLAMPSLVITTCYHFILQAVTNTGIYDIPFYFYQLLFIAGAFSIANEAVGTCVAFMAAKFYHVAKHVEALDKAGPPATGVVPGAALQGS